MRRSITVIAVLLSCLIEASPVVARRAAASTPAPLDGVHVLLDELATAVQAGTPDAYLALLAPGANRSLARQFVKQNFLGGVTRVVVRERARGPLSGTLPGDGYNVVIDAFIERGPRARVVTWQIAVRRERGDGPGHVPIWRIAGQKALETVQGLKLLSLDPTEEFEARDFVVHAEDMELRLPVGVVFLSKTDEGTTALVMLGHGEMRFHPAPATEQGQVKIFCGSDTLDTPFGAAFVRLNPGDLDNHVLTTALVQRPVDADDLKKANAVFHDEMVKSFTLDMSEFTTGAWSLLPPFGDFLAEVRTDHFGTLTYARSMEDPEDITLFDRRHQHNIALYASKEKLAQRGPFYNDEELARFDVRHYNIDASFDPSRLLVSGRASLTVHVRAPSINHLTLKLADSLALRSIYSEQYGRLLALRVRGQDSIVVNLPTAVPKDTDFNLTIVYAGRLEPQSISHDTIEVGQVPHVTEGHGPIVAPAPSYLYSNETYWYPQTSTDDYATATLRLTVPLEYRCVASGAMASGSPVRLPAADGVPARKLYVFVASQPLRYFACVLSHFVRLAADPVTVRIPRSARLPPGTGGDGPADRRPGVYYNSLQLSVETNRQEESREKPLRTQAAAIVRFYASLMGDCPYPSFTLALLEGDLPGGHSPGYFAVLKQALPTTPFRWQSDPAWFPDFPQFFLAHEIAHQWWGQAVGPANYHEQWLSEGFAQFFAALYAQHTGGEGVFEDILHKMRRWALAESDQGPIYLGYRLGHIKNDSRVYRALVYDKSAVVLHMLSRLLGRDVFFAGLRRFYLGARFRDVNTDDLRKAMEAEAHVPLSRFFDRWIYGDGIPRLQFSDHTETGPDGPVLALHVEQVGQELYDLPLTVTVEYNDKPSRNVVMKITSRVVDMRVPLAGSFRGVEVNHDDAALATIERK